MESLFLLKQLGFSENESRLYLVLLEMKKATVSQVAKRVSLSRSTVYDSLESLARNGVVLKVVKNNKIVYWCDRLERIEKHLEERKRTIEQQTNLFRQYLPDLAKVFKESIHEPKVRFFEGDDSYKDFYQISLDERPKEIVGYVSSRSFFEFIDDEAFAHRYIREKFRKRIAGRYFIQSVNIESELAYMNDYYKKYLSSWKDFVRVKVMPSHTQKSGAIHETMVFNDKLAISAVQKPFFGIVLASEVIAATQRVIFESLWKTVREEIKIYP